MPVGGKRPSLERSPGSADNWVEKAGGLPAFIDKVARALHQSEGMPIARAIATAISRAKVWAAKGNARAASAVAQWEAMKGRSKAKKVDMAVPAFVREKALDKGNALPPAKGKPAGEARFPINNASDLDKAIRMVGLASGDKNVVRRYIMQRARALKLESKIPSNWNPDGSVGSASKTGSSPTAGSKPPWVK